VRSVSEVFVDSWLFNLAVTVSGSQICLYIVPIDS